MNDSIDSLFWGQIEHRAEGIGGAPRLHDGCGLAIGLQVPSCYWEEQPVTTDDDDGWCVWFLDVDIDPIVDTHGRALLVDNEQTHFVQADLTRQQELLLSGDVVNLVPPIVHTTENGNYIIRGRGVTDPEALGQMTIPDHETCVEVSRSAIAGLVGG